MSEALPVGASFPLVLTWIIFFGVRLPVEAIASFAHDSALFIMGALMMARVLVRRDLHQRALTLFLGMAPPRVPALLAVVMAFAAMSLAIISDHTVAALLLPVGTTLVVAAGGVREHPRLANLFMLAIAYSCAIGGMATPSGGTRNVIMLAYLQNIAGAQLSYRLWLTMALPITVVLVPIVGVLLYHLYRLETQDLRGVEDQVVKRRQRVGSMDGSDWAPLVLLAWITVGEQYGIGLIAIGGSRVYLLVGLADWDEDYQHISWGIVLLYFAAITFGRALEASGAASWLADRVMLQVQTRLGLESGIRLAMSSSVFMTLFSQTMSDGPAVALLGPVVLESARLTNASPILVGMATALSSSFAYVMIIGTPANAIIYSSGYLEARDFLGAGFWVALVSLAVLLLVAALWWPRLGVM